MSYKTLEVEIENGRIIASGAETLPGRARGLLTLLSESGGTDTRKGPAKTGAELAARLAAIKKLPPEEAEAFARDIEEARASLPPLKSAWD